jgi:8-oxo-dGTP diphosphatase
MTAKPFRLVLRAVLRDHEGKILLMRRSARSLSQPGSWELPGGKPDAGEDIDTALRREMKEETGFDVELLDVIGHSQWETESARLAYLIFSVRAAAGRFQLSDEHDASAWVEDSKVLSYDISPQLKTFFKDSLSRDL